MAFDELLGNSRLKENLSRSLENNRISHFYLISGPKGAGKHTLARLLAAAILCREPDRPCRNCHSCRKVLEGSHPDFITVEDAEHKTVAVKLVRQAREDMYIRPNEAEYKVYLFPQELGIEGQNALLKILEEPPKYGVFLLLTDNPEQLLPTVRSRCTPLALQPLPEAVLKNALMKEFPQAGDGDLEAAIARSGGFLGQAKTILQEGAALPAHTEQFARAFAQGNALLLTETLVPMEKWKRDAFVPAMQQWCALLQSALSCRCAQAAAGSAARELAAKRNPRDLRSAIDAVQKAIEYAQGNVSVAAICGWLTWELR